MKILILSQISTNCLEYLKKSHEVMNCKVTEITEGNQAEVLIVRSNVKVGRNLLDKLPQLRLIIKAGSGVDNIDIKEVEKRKIDLQTTPANKYSVSELCILFILAFRRNFLFMNKELKRGNWDLKYNYIGNSLNGSILGIIGYGNIGSQLSYIARAFGMNVLIYDHNPKKDEKQKHCNKTDAQFVALNTIFSEADHISLHLPLTDVTKNFIDKGQLSLMKNDAVLINTARAEIIDYDSLYSTLINKKILGLGLDSHYNEPVKTIEPLLKLENVLCTPHIGSQTVENMELIGTEILKIIKERERVNE